jgi:hypothetical protein
LIGVDLLPDGEGGWVVLELNGAVEWTREYSLDRDPFVAAAWELARVALGCPLGPTGPGRVQHQQVPIAETPATLPA